jgi:hypothetical protein
LHIEELEERIAPVVVDGTIGSWIQGDAIEDPANPGTFIPIVNAYPDNPDEYWIFYVGPGQADIGPGATVADLDGNHITTITITGSTMESALFILDFPGDPTPDPDDAQVDIQNGTLRVTGDIVVNGDIGLIEIDGVFGPLPGIPPMPTMTVLGDLGKLDVGILLGDVFVTGDIHEIAVDGTLGAVHDPDADIGELDGWWRYLTKVEANGNIGAVRVGVGLSDKGEGTSSTDIIGGMIDGLATIRANADGVGPPGIIDLIEVRAGSLYDGSLGLALGDTVPSLSAGPGGNIRFLTIDGLAYWTGPGISTTIEEITVTPTSPLAERTIVDDSGGVLVISPQIVEFTDDVGDVTATYEGEVTYLVVPVDPTMQGPGVTVARLSANWSNTFSITGNVEIGDFRIGPDYIYPEGQAIDFEDPDGPQSIDDLEITSAGVLTELEGYARDVFTGTGEADIYLVNADPGLGAGGSDIPLIINHTYDGDIVAVAAAGDIIYVGASSRGGDIGATESITPHLLKGALYFSDGDILWVDDNENAETISPFGVEGSLTRYNAILGVSAEGTVYGLQGGGAIGDVRVSTGDVHFVNPNANGVRDAGSPLAMGNIIEVPVGSSYAGGISAVEAGGYAHIGSVSPFGKTENIVGDGIFGKIMLGTGNAFSDTLGDPGLSGGGNIELVRVGEGSGRSICYYHNAYPVIGGFDDGTGTFVTAGIYASGYIDRVVANGSGRGIYGDVIADSADPETGFNINLVSATGGAVIRGDLWPGVILAGATDATCTSEFSTSGIVGTVSASGAGSIISNMSILGYGINRVTATGGSNGIDGCWIYGSEGAINLISADGPGIADCDIFANGAAGTIKTVGVGSAIVDTEIQALAGLKNLSTNALTNDYIYLVTLGSLSTLDSITDTYFYAGGLRRITVRNDVIGSNLVVAGPLDSLRVNGDLMGSTVAATGMYGDIGRIVVRGDMMPITPPLPASPRPVVIFSGSNIDLIQSITGSMIDVEITAVGSGDLDVDLTTTNVAKIGRITARGDITGEVNIGIFDENSVNPALDYILKATLGAVRAGGAINADFIVGSGVLDADMGGNVTITARTSSFTAGGGIDGSITVGEVTTTGATAVGDINGDVDIFARTSTIRSRGDINADITVGIVDSANNINGDVTMDARLSGVIADGSINGEINVGVVIAGGSVNGSVTIPEYVGQIRAGGGITGDIYVGTVDTVLGGVNGDVTFAARLSSVRADGDITGSLYVGSAAEGVPGAGTVGGRGDIGSVITKGGFTGYLDAGRNVSSIRADGNVGDVGGATTINVGGNLSVLKAGSRTVPGDLYSDVTVGGNLNNVTVTGSAPVTLTVGGNISRVSALGGLGELGDAVTAGGRLGNMTIGDRFTISDLLADVTVSAGNLGTLRVSGDMRGLVDVQAGNVSRMDIGRILSDITISGNLYYLTTQSGPVPISPTEYQFINPGDTTGTLTVGGRIGIIV